jgi:hypothetical protein
MKFLNDKEQVIDLKITPHGKSLLSIGRFKPQFYAFYDDEVLYDSQYGGFAEHQNSASVRIKDIPQLETQTYFYSAEKKLKEEVELNSDQEDTRINWDRTKGFYTNNDKMIAGTISDRDFNKSPIGNSSPNSSFAPAWNVNIVEGEILSSSVINPGLDLPIPQINMSSSMAMFSLSNTPQGGNFYEFDQSGDLTPQNPFKDLYLNVLDNRIILEIREENTEFEWENFDLEIFEVETATTPQAQNTGGSNTKEFLKPLFIKPNISNIRNNILLDDNEMPAEVQVITPEFAEYYFDIIIDSGIDPDLVCKRAINKPEGVFNQRIIDCDPQNVQEEVSIEDLYNPGATVICPEDDE